MSASQFEDLLGDFGDSTATTTSTTIKTSSSAAFDDDFDPFGPSSGAGPTSNGDSGLLLDFLGDSDIKNGEASNEVDTSSDSAQPLYDITSSNPLYDLSSQSGNPVYEFENEGDNNQSANPLYEMSADASTSASAPTNPLYDFEDEGSGAGTLSYHHHQQQEEEEEEGEAEEGANEEEDYQPEVVNGDSRHWPSDDPAQQEEEDVEEEQLQDYSEKLEEAPPVRGVSEEQDQMEASTLAAAAAATGEDVEAVTVVVEEQEDLQAASSSSQVEDASFGQDRREVDLELYCMDREESDLMDEHESGGKCIEKQDMDMKDEKKQEEEVQDGRTVSRATEKEKRLSGSDLESPPTSLQQGSSSHLEEAANVGHERGSGQEDGGHYYQRSSVKKTFQSQPAALPQTSEDHTFQQWQNEEEEEEEEEGIYENQPVPRDDVVRYEETDRTKDLPAAGTAHNLRAKFLSEAQQSQTYTPRSKREITPPAHGAGGEYVSEPRAYIEKYEPKTDAGVFESQPVPNPDVITSDTHLEDATYESGFAKNTAARFKELSNQTYTPSSKKELTPDQSGQTEYVSEPRGQFESYEGKAESGVFESEPVTNPDVVRSGETTQEPLPERGTAKNLANKFLQISNEISSSSNTPRGKRELTPDRSGQVEYVSEPKAHLEEYEVRVDAGVFENQPKRSTDVITSDSATEEYVPERGHAKTVAAKFKVLESTAKSPPLSPGRRKEFTPPREDEAVKISGVIENTPEVRTDIVHADDHLEEKLPERGTAKNIAQRFRQLEAESQNPSPRQKKELTPPPKDAGVYENQPQQFQADYNRPAESGIIENQPIKRDDVIRGDEPPKYEEELPERGAAKNLVNKWKQMESESAKTRSPGSGGRPKEFTPPREEPRIAEQRKSPRTPLSPSGHGQLDNGSVHPSDLPGQYQPQNEASVFESQPVERTDVLKESDTDRSQGLPKKDTAKKMLAKFQSLQAEANKQTGPPLTRKESECSETESDLGMENAKLKFEDPEKVGRSKSMRAAIQVEKCGACEKTVYAMERLEMNKRVYHKACFRCTHCKAVLTPKTFAINNDVIFCTTHYKQLFATKGNYDEGFGRIQHKKRWSSNPNLAAQDGEGQVEHAIVKS